ncbi:hypothetical protein, partial [Streptomyces zaomyceticus]|uniref:hypothetical protein n=1 Tax=Streptomyces zaomyceticus TaxID=68286 RepID=UPI00367E762D
HLSPTTPHLNRLFNSDTHHTHPTITPATEGNTEASYLNHGPAVSLEERIAILEVAIAIVRAELGEAALNDPVLIKGAQLVRFKIWPGPSITHSREVLDHIVRIVVLHTSQPDAEVTEEHISQLFKFANTAYSDARWALEDMHALAAYHLMQNADLYGSSAETATPHGNSVILRQWQFPHVDKILTRQTLNQLANGIWEQRDSSWPDDIYILGLTPDERDELTIGAHVVPFEVLLYVAEHDPARQVGTDIVLAVPGAADGQYNDAIARLNWRLRVSIFAPRKDVAHLMLREYQGSLTCMIVDKSEGTFGDWVVWTGFPRNSAASSAEIGAAAESENKSEASTRIFTDVSGTIKFTVDEVVRRPVMSGNGKNVMGVSTTPDPDTTLIRGGALDGIDFATQIMMFDEASGASVSTLLDCSPGVVVVFAGRGSNVLFRLSDDRDIELSREEAALLYGEMPEINSAIRHLQETRRLRHQPILILDGNLPSEGESGKTEGQNSMELLFSIVFGRHVQHTRSGALIEIQERAKMRARPASMDVNGQVLMYKTPEGFSKFIGGSWSSSDELADFATMIQLVSRMKTFSGLRFDEFSKLTPVKFAQRILDEYQAARPQLKGLTYIQLRPHFVEEVLSEASFNGALQLGTFLSIPLLRGIDAPKKETFPGAELTSSSHELDNPRQFVSELAPSMSKQKQAEFTDTLRAAYRIIPPHYHSPKAPRMRLRAYLDRAILHATAPNRPVREKSYRHIIQLISDAQKAGRAGSDATLTAYLLQRGGLFDRTPLLTAPPEKTTLRDFSHRVTRLPSSSEHYKLHSAQNPFGKEASNIEERENAAWGDGPYVVTAETVMDGLVVIEKGVHGWEVLAELVAHDPDR